MDVIWWDFGQLHKSCIKLGKEPHAAHELRLATPVLLYSVLAQNENELVHYSNEF